MGGENTKIKYPILILIIILFLSINVINAIQRIAFRVCSSLDLRDRYQPYKKNLIFVLKNKEEEENITLAKVLKEFEKIDIYYDNFDENLELLARSMFIDGSQLPMIIITGGRLKGAAAFSGYNVGLGHRVLQIIDLAAHK